MNNNPIKIWEYTLNGYNYSIKYDAKIVSQIFSNENNSMKPVESIFKLKDCLIRHFPLGHLAAVDTELMLLISQELSLDYSFSKKQERHLKFWEAIDCSKIPNLIFTSLPRNLIMDLSSDGVRIGFYKNDEKVYTQEESLDNLFFYGPNLEALSLEDRKVIRQTIFNALNPNSGLKLADAFPLFDYNKITPQKWEHSNDGGRTGEWLSLENGYITFGGWYDQGKGGGCSNYSLELEWKRREQKVKAGPFQAAYEYIYKVLETAIIKE